ncbi:hypothetical protein [Amycolatopsis jejuensis]|uniref:hypothetical protein n=1 Tax=Amycolatopsis jejuensis TaxID=330084 RepID=UPI0005268A0C|nr:hypothetical protein [Amycolatopsis jejuensis]
MAVRKRLAAAIVAAALLGLAPAAILGALSPHSTTGHVVAGNGTGGGGGPGEGNGGWGGGPGGS